MRDHWCEADPLCAFLKQLSRLYCQPIFTISYGLNLNLAFSFPQKFKDRQTR